MYFSNQKYATLEKTPFFCLLDSVTVLPPGEWDPSIRIEPPQSLPSQESRKHPKAQKEVVDEEEEEEKMRESAGLVRSGKLFPCLSLLDNAPNLLEGLRYPKEKF